MPSSINVFIVFLLICSALSLIIGDANKVCRIQDIRNTVGVCKTLTDCPAVIGLLRAGVKPTPCFSTESPLMVCCPSKERISSEKCDEFMKILTQPVKGKHALVYDGGHSEQKSDDNTIKCETFFLAFISGGTNAKLRQFPYQVALGYGEKPDWRCGGTLIDPSYVLTAGHCVRTTFGPPTVILLGDRRLSEKRDPSRILVNVSEIYLHPKYRPPLQYNDIAIIKLAVPVTLSRAILPACLPNPFDRLDRVIGVEATGWGRTGAFDEQSDILKSATLAKYDIEECASFFQTDNANKNRLPNGIIRSQFCAGDKHGLRDTCQGDSGGPVTVEHHHYSCIRYVVGITSFGSSLCGYQQPGVYTSVLSYLDWVEEIVWGNLSTKEGTKIYASVGSYDNDKLILDPLVNGGTTTATTITPGSMTYPGDTEGTSGISITTSTSPTTHSQINIQTTSSPQPSLTSVLTLETTLLPSMQQWNQKYKFLNISSTVADLLNKFSLGR